MLLGKRIHCWWFCYRLILCDTVINFKWHRFLDILLLWRSHDLLLYGIYINNLYLITFHPLINFIQEKHIYILQNWFTITGLQSIKYNTSQRPYCKQDNGAKWSSFSHRLAVVSWRQSEKDKDASWIIVLVEKCEGQVGEIERHL